MGQIWFGTRGYMQWLKDPAVGGDISNIDWNTNTQLLNGKKYVRRSNNAHREYNFTWNLAKRATLQPFIDYASGAFGSTVYWVDPFAADRNMFPMDWSMPYLGGLDGTILNGGDTRPTLTPTAANGYWYPSQSVTYTVVSGQWVPEVYLPIPPGYTMYLGFHGIAGTGGTVSYAVCTGTSTGSYTAFTPLSTSSATRTNVSVTSGAGDGVSVKLTGSGTVTMTGLTAVLLPTSGSVAPTGAFVSGSGNRGCTFQSQPVVQAYSAALDMVGLSATLIEVQ